MQRKVYANVKITVTRTIEFMADENMDDDALEDIVFDTVNDKWGRDTETTIEEMDWADNPPDMITDEMWDRVKDDFDIVMGRYKDLLGVPGVATAPALAIVFDPLLRRFNSGERSWELYDEMQGVE